MRETKPHLRRCYSGWQCVSFRRLLFAGSCPVAGYGDTPEEAYADWVKIYRGPYAVLEEKPRT